VFAASALLLAACGSEPVGPTDPSPDENGGEIGDNPLLFQISPANMYFNTTDGTVPGPQTVATTGLVAIGSMVTFDRFSYGDEGVTPWLRVAPVPTFQREPLAWLNSVWVDPAAYNALPVRDEPYTAVVHANVVAAQNTPQHLFVQLCNDPDGCYSLRLGDVKMDSFDPSMPHWGHGSDPSSVGEFPYRDWTLYVEPFSTVYVQQIGSAYVVCPETGALGTSSDMYLYVGPPGMNFTDSDDDSCGYASQLQVTNGSGSVMTYRIRSTTYADASSHSPPTYLVYGTYTIRVVSVPFFGFALREEPSPAERERLQRLKVPSLN
jgi:hypothetical protein